MSKKKNDLPGNLSKEAKKLSDKAKASKQPTVDFELSDEELGDACGGVGCTITTTEIPGRLA